MKSLLETIDDAAAKLLARAMAGDSVPLIEAVKAFEAATRWAEMKTRLPATQPVDAKVNGFERIRGKFHGRKAGGGAPAPAPEAAPADLAPDPFAGVARPTTGTNPDALRSFNS